MVLNMLSTATMVRLGYVSGNRMSNLQARNIKLRERARRVLQTETGLDEAEATKALESANGDLRVAIVMVKAGVRREDAVKALESANWVVEPAISLLQKT
jgi:N-acetylmuramic acid 6-phosphate etherase